jgi:hypothetical protein
MPRDRRPTLKPSLALRLRRAIAMRVRTYKDRGRPVRYRVKPLMRTKGLVRGSDGELHVEPQSQHHIHGSFNVREAARAYPAYDRGELKAPEENVSEFDDEPEGETEVQDALTREKFTVAQLTKAIQARKPQIHERTVRRYLSRKEPLAKEAAIDLILGCVALGFKVPSDLLDEINADDLMPPVIAFPGSSERLAAMLTAKAATILNLNARDVRRVKEGFLEFLEGYERFNKTGLGRELLDKILSRIESEYGKRWEWRLNETYMAYNIGLRPVGKAGLMRDAYTAPSPLGLIQKLGRKARRK